MRTAASRMSFRDFASLHRDTNSRYRYGRGTFIWKYQKYRILEWASVFTNGARRVEYEIQAQSATDVKKWENARNITEPGGSA